MRGDRAPVLRRGYPVWSDALERGEDRVEILFVGRGPEPRPDRRELLRRLGPTASDGPSPGVGWVRQVHSARVRAAEVGACGEGDALVTDRRDLALSVVTADCVPILLASKEPGGGLAAVHAGWRGIAVGILASALGAIGVSPRSLVAWVGPAIGPCCYEVGPDVAEQVATVSTKTAVRPNPNPMCTHPYLDLQGAIRHQLATAGVAEVRSCDRCTRCHPDELWSYRHEGKRAGRNHAFVWSVLREL